MEILIVDDNQISRELLHHTLTTNGYDVVSARDGQEALDVLQERDCRIVVTDWMMPRISGLELCRKIRETHVSRYIYTIIVTHKSEIKDTIEGLNAGADDFVTKPFWPLELIARVRAGERIVNLETRDLTIFALAKLADSRDPETGLHLERIRNYSRTIATYLMKLPKFNREINAEFVRLIYLTSPLHDMGKVAIPDGVLLKPGKLTEGEFEIMQTHTIHGAMILEAALMEFPNARYLRMASDIAAYHHERFDGAGYPRGLSGGAIPLAARIVALADVYDALTSKRVYKDAFGHDYARSAILQGSGTQFDPDIVDAFIGCEQEFVQIRQRYAEPDDKPKAIPVLTT
jgi:putative two-component system response regulator